jgi:hypothetical protein
MRVKTDENDWLRFVGRLSRQVLLLKSVYFRKMFSRSHSNLYRTLFGSYTVKTEELFGRNYPLLRNFQKINDYISGVNSSPKYRINLVLKVEENI